jgi:hypothetical protein
MPACEDRGRVPQGHLARASPAGRRVLGCVLCACLCPLSLPLSAASGDGADSALWGGEKWRPPRTLEGSTSVARGPAIVRLRGGTEDRPGGVSELRGCSRPQAEVHMSYVEAEQSMHGEDCSGCGGHEEIKAGMRGGAAAACDGVVQGPDPFPLLHEHMWHQDVGERYKQLLPPRHPSRNQRHTAASIPPIPFASDTQAADIRDAVAKASLSSHLPLKCVDEVNMFLDLDKAAIWGNDGNDFGIALQWMERPYTDVLTLYKHLLNPNVKQTYKALSARANKVRVVLYTMRSSLLLYNSCFRDAEHAVVPLLWNPTWHVHGQLYLPPDLATSDQVMAQTQWAQELMDAERLDMKNALERLLAVREVIQGELNLAERPLVVVSKERKSVMQTARVLNLDCDTCYLWDDNTNFAPHENVVRVAPYVAMPEARRAALLKFLYR